MSDKPTRGDRLLKFTGLLVVLISALVGWLMWDYRTFTQTPLALQEEWVLIVQPGRSVRAIARDLTSQGIIDNPWFLEWMARRHGAAERIKAGEYHLQPGLLPQALLDQLVTGKVVQYAFTIVEGWTFRQLLAALSEHKALRHSLQGKSDDEIMAALGHAGQHPEGRFLPDTYHFPRDTTDVAFLKRAYTAMERVLEREWMARAENLPLETAYEALILASIVEKETGVAAERAQIAGVFVRRLQKGMRLQTDPTVIYGLGADFDGDIKFRDLRTDTAYNTYTRHGLPPTPIALPGQAAIHAALHPAPGDSLFFVSKGDGSHVFSATLEEHNRAVRTYQLKR